MPKNIKNTARKNKVVAYKQAGGTAYHMTDSQKQGQITMKPAKKKKNKFNIPWLFGLPTKDSPNKA
tara:strand:- start:202 stop:399 length:198 start_codon:yes stop_codon:yes gene_type:complete